MLNGKRRLVRRRAARGWMLLPSLALHLAVFVPLAVIPWLPPLAMRDPPPATLEIVADIAPEEAAPPAPDPPAPPPPPDEPPPADVSEVVAPEPPKPEPPPKPTPPPPRPAPMVVRAPRQASQAAEPQGSREPAKPAEEPDTSLHVEAAGLSPDWVRQLQAWWDLHAFYPPEAAAKGVSGTAKVHLLIHPDGEVWIIKVMQSSGSEVLDTAAFEIFHHAHLRPFPAGTPAPQADADITMHYVLAPAKAGSGRKPFTVTNEPVHGTAVDKVQQKVCTGEVVEGAWGRDSIFGTHVRVTAIFFRKPDGTPWVDWSPSGRTPLVAPVTEQGVSAHWTGLPALGPPMNRGPNPHYAVWPTGDNRLSGNIDFPPGSVDLTCE
jgi:protein TonB